MRQRTPRRIKSIGNRLGNYDCNPHTAPILHPYIRVMRVSLPCAVSIDINKFKPPVDAVLQFQIPLVAQEIPDIVSSLVFPI